MREVYSKKGDAWQKDPIRALITGMVAMIYEPFIRLIPGIERGGPPKEITKETVKIPGSEFAKQSATKNVIKELLNIDKIAPSLGEIKYIIDGKKK